MRIRKQQAGFAVVELVIVVVILAAIVAVGLWMHNKQSPKAADATTPSPTSQTESPVAHNVSSAPAVNTTSDLDKALSTLNNNDPSSANAADTSELSTQANAF